MHIKTRCLPEFALFAVFQSRIENVFSQTEQYRFIFFMSETTGTVYSASPDLIPYTPTWDMIPCIQKTWYACNWWGVFWSFLLVVLGISCFRPTLWLSGLTMSEINLRARQILLFCLFYFFFFFRKGGHCSRVFEMNWFVCKCECHFVLFEVIFVNTQSMVRNFPFFILYHCSGLNVLSSWLWSDW